eukprot:TRINITY_DN5699_c0_g1_i3.p1 TRINITY_DN5699_c0_g1~~TRINITY_DN5699_c0_g1_i3.p1  ORF type:complete len:641 (-),score=250.99 TRINITY_DN5699_c0_g1_i3:287-2209(-)
MGCGSSSEAPLVSNPSARFVRNLSVPAGSQFVGVLVITVAEARGLIGTDIGGSADPFVTLSFGKSTFKTKCVKTSLAPVWGQRTAIPVTTAEQNYSLVCNVWDEDDMSANDLMGVCTVPIAPLLDGKPSDVWHPLWSHSENTLGRQQQGELRLKIDLQTQQEIEQQFWTQMVKLFDYDETGTISRLEFSALLEALGSKLTDSAIDKLFASGDQNKDDSIDAAEIQLLMSRPEAREEFGGLARCPLCQHEFAHDGEVVVHLGGCLLNSDGSADDLLSEGFLTNKEAAKGWIAKLSEWVNFGDYGLGANSGNILVVNRATGAVEEEKIPPFVRTSIRLLYQKSASAAKVQKLLKAMTLKMGKRYADPRSQKEIVPFIKFHELNVDEILLPLESYANFNEFFYRKLKATARPIASPEDPTVLVSPADCRLNAFALVDDATRLWVKGKQFTLKALLRDDDVAAKFDGGSMAICRLAPQDYHRFHFPCNGTLGKPRPLEGAFYTVSPMAVRGDVNVFTDNVRCISLIDSPEFGTVAYICVGATMVGSIVLTSHPDGTINKGDEHGYFQFGGSTIIMLFQPGMVKFDQDLLDHSNTSVETLVKMGVQIGRSTRTIVQHESAGNVEDQVTVDQVENGSVEPPAEPTD